MKYIWLRQLGRDEVVFTRPFTYFTLGIRGSGKSSLLEHIAEQFLKEGSTILDLFGSRDGEGLAWCRSPWAEEKKILLIHGDNTTISCPSKFDKKPVSAYKLSDLENYDIIISSGPLYSSPGVEYQAANIITDMIYQRLHWKRKVYMVTREAANLYYSRLKSDPNQVNAKAQMIYLVREARHMGYALGLDTLKYTSIDVDMRITVDYMFFKNQGAAGLPSELKWCYAYLNPFAIQNLRRNEFVILTKAGSLGFGSFPEVMWHKLEGEDILRACRIEVQHGDDYIPSRIGRRVGDLDHARIVEGRMAGKNYIDIARDVGFSDTQCRTHVTYHNDSWSKVGFCERCKRCGNPLATVYITKGGHKK